MYLRSIKDMENSYMVVIAYGHKEKIISIDQCDNTGINDSLFFLIVYI